jgi:nitrogen-specific signal transduction histidine kinase
VGPADEENDKVSVEMSRRATGNGEFDPEAVFDPLTAMQDPETDLGPVISQKIISNQHGQVDAWHDEGHVTMRVLLPRSESQPSSGQEVL